MDNISEIDTQEGIRVAWHKKTIVREDLSLDNNRLRTWDAVPKHLLMEGGEGDYQEIPDMQLVCSDDWHIRLGRPFNPKSYQPLTNQKFLDMIKEAVSGTQHRVTSVLSTRRRCRTAVSLSLEGLNEYDTGGHHFEPFLNFGNSYDESSTLWHNTSNIESVCDNTFGFNQQLAEGGHGGSYRHTPGLLEKLPEIAKLIDAAVGVHREFAEAFESLSKIAASPREANFVFLGFVADPEAEEASQRAKNMSRKLGELFGEGPGCKGQDRSDMFSAMTNYYTHGSRASFRQIHSSEFGFGAQRKREFLGYLTNDDKYGGLIDRGVELLRVK